MYKKFELREMDIEKLRTLAEELKIKGFKKMEKDDLIYAILDEEARKTCIENFEAIKSLAELMAQEELEDFINADY